MLSTVDSAQLGFREHHLEHHIAHIASAYYCSPWDKAAGFSYDGSGDFVSTMTARCEGSEIEVLDRVFLPHSLGSFYTMISVNSSATTSTATKVRSWASRRTGKYTYCDEISKIVTTKNGGFQLDLSYFKPLGSNQGMQVLPDGTVQLARHFSDRMEKLFGEPREAHAEITQRDMDLAFAVQHRFEELFFHLLNQLHGSVPLENLAFAGGCALNSVANGKLFDCTPFPSTFTYIQPAAGDEGLAIGAALHTYHSVLKQSRRLELKQSYLGPEFSDSRILSALQSAGLQGRKLERSVLLEETAEQIAAGNVVGWFQGRMEWGPRALGNRSIVAHPGLPNMKDVLNARIKRREWFRPFAPSILADRQHEYFEYDHPSPFMLHVYKIRPEKRKELCAVNHVDDTGRLQTVTREENPMYYDLISAFGRKTGTPVILNTSFNENEPIVCTPEEAIDCFQRTRMDVLAIGPFLVLKAGRGVQETAAASSVRDAQKR